MAVPKTFTGGERLFASDLNDNFDFLEDAVDNAGADFSTAGSNTVALDFSKDRIITRAADGNVTFTGSNYTAGKSATVRIVPGGSNRTLTFPSGWKFVSLKPASILSGKTAVLTATCFGATEANVVAAYAVEG